MSWQQQFRLYLWLLRFLGLLPGEFCEVRQNFVSSAGDLRRSVFTTILGVCVVESLLIWIAIAAFENKFQLFTYSKIANNLVLIQLVVCALVQLGFSLGFFLNRGKHMTLMSVLFKQALQLPKTKQSADLAQRLRNNFWLSVGIFTVFELNITYDFVIGGNELAPVVLTLSFWLLTIHMMFAICLMGSYTAIVLIIHYILKFYNDSLRPFCSGKAVSYKEGLYVVCVLRSRSELLQVCCTHLNQVYGLAMMLESCYLLCTLPMCPLLLTIFFEHGIPELKQFLGFVLNCVIWSSPPLITFVVALKGNAILLEANRTARILSSVPRTGAGIEKMVEKFLLKNLRQKPILTAYGFFSLDKSTLFKLFTAISTYMVILVQFKEMESANGAVPAAQQKAS